MTRKKPLAADAGSTRTFARSFAVDLLRRGFRSYVEEVAEREPDATLRHAVAAYLNGIEATLRDLRATNGAT